MFRRATLLVLLVLCCAALAQAQAPGADSALPLYGGRAKTPAQQEADRKYVEEALREAGTREKAVDTVMTRGWDYLKKGDPVTAIKRFNQASLLTPDNPDVFWGLGAAVSEQGKHDESIGLFERAQALRPNDPALMLDFGYALIWKGAEGSKTTPERMAAFDRAQALFEQAEALQPNNPQIYGNRAILQFYQGRYAESWQSVAKAQALDPGSVDAVFLRRLSAKLPRPASR